MASVDYTNPFASLDPSAYGEGKTALEMFMADQKAKQAQPFIDMARQQQQMGLQQKQQEMQEFMSPQAQQARMSGFGATAATNQQKIELTPHQTAQQIDEARQKIRSSGSLTDAKIAEAEAAIVKAKGSPYESLFKDFGALGTALEKLPKETHSMVYTNYINQWKAKHPGLPLPPGLENYDKDTEWQLKAAAYADLTNRKAENDIKLKEIEVRERAKSTGVSASISAQGQLAVEKLRQEGQDRREDLRAGTKEEQLANRKAEALAKTTAQLLSADINYGLTQDPEVKKQKFEAAYEQAQRIHGVSSQPQNTTQKPPKPKTPPPAGKVLMYSPKERKWGAVPKEQVEQAKQEGYSE